MGSEPIKPCPFCGSSDVMESYWEGLDEPETWCGMVYCYNCDAQGPAITHPQRTTVVRRAREGWNLAPRKDTNSSEPSEPPDPR